MLFHHFIGALLALGLLASPLLGSDVTLVKDGQPTSAIVLAKEPAKIVLFAAHELQHHLKLITGAEVPIVPEGEPLAAGVTPIYVGHSDATASMGLSNEAFASQERLVRVSDDAVVLVGHDYLEPGEVDYAKNGKWSGAPDVHSPLFQVGTLYAVYDFLEDLCGVRWYMPGEVGTVYDKTDTLSVRSIDERRTPPMKHRVLGTGSWGKPGTFGIADRMGYLRSTDYGNTRDNVLYNLRSRFNGSGLSHHAHALQRYTKSHGHMKDWWVGSEPGRGVQLRLWKQEVVDQIVSDILASFAKQDQAAQAGDNPYAADLAGPAKFANLGPDDNRIFGPDADPPAQPERKRPGTFSDGIYSNYWFTFVNKVAKRVGEKYPDAWIVSPAYASHFEPPTFDLESNIGVFVANTEGWEEDSYGVQTIRDWTRKVSRVNTYEYWYSHAKLPPIRPHEIAAYVKLLRDAGVEGMFMEIISAENPATHHLDYFIHMHSMYDSEAPDVEKVLDEYFTRFYGPAEAPMRRFVTLLEEAYRDQQENTAKKDSRHQAWLTVQQSGLFEKLDAALTEAEKLATQSPYADRVKIMRSGIYEMFRYNVELADRIVNTPLPVVVAARVNTTPVIDGKLDDELWKQATETEGFEIVENWRNPVTTKELPRSENTAKVAWDGENLYLGVRIANKEKKPYKLAQTHPSPGVCTDESIEVVLDPGHKMDRQDYMHIQLSANNVYWHQWTRYGWCQPVPVDLGTQTATHIGEDFWSAEIVIPLAILADGKLPKAGEEWGLNIYSNQAERSSSEAWSRTFGTWHIIEKFGIVKFGE